MASRRQNVKTKNSIKRRIAILEKALMRKKRVRVTLRIDADLWLKIRKLAFNAGKSINRYVIDEIIKPFLEGKD
ncbi:MAG: hypothetical protein QXZ53_06015 [Candidatus Bathyarchaeia archaeon]